MPGFPFPGRPGGEHDEPLLDMLVARRVLPPDAPQPMHDLALMLAALAGPAEPGELAGEVAVRAAFSRAASPASISSAARQPGRRRRTRRFRGLARSRARLATALVAAAAALSSVFAAYIGVLPGPIQQLAHVTVAAPAPPSVAPRQSRPHRSGRTAPGQAPIGSPAGRPAPSPHPSTGSAPSPGQAIYRKPSFKPSATGAAGHGAPGPICIPAPWPSPGTPGKPSAHPSPPSWSQVSPGEHCTSLPTGPSGKPTLTPSAPLTGAQRVTTAP